MRHESHKGRKTHTPIRYSTARSGLLKLALRARTTSSRGKPISIILVIEASKALPVTKLGSEGAALTGFSSVVVVVVVAGAGAGAGSVVSVVVVVGASTPASRFVAGVGATGVLAGGGAAAVEVEADVDATGAALACN